LVPHSSQRQRAPYNSASRDHFTPEVIKVHITSLKMSFSSIQRELLPAVKHSMVVETEHISGRQQVNKLGRVILQEVGKLPPSLVIGFHQVVRGVEYTFNFGGPNCIYHFAIVAQRE